MSSTRDDSRFFTRLRLPFRGDAQSPEHEFDYVRVHLPESIAHHPAVSRLCALLASAGMLMSPIPGSPPPVGARICPAEIHISPQNPSQVVVADIRLQLPEDDGRLVRALLRSNRSAHYLQGQRHPGHTLHVGLLSQYSAGHSLTHRTVVHSLSQAMALSYSRILVLDISDGSGSSSHKSSESWNDLGNPITWETLATQLRTTDSTESIKSTIDNPALKPAVGVKTPQLITGLLRTPLLAGATLRTHKNHEARIHVLGWAARARSLSITEISTVLDSADQLGMATMTDCGTDNSLARTLEKAGVRLVLNTGALDAEQVTTEWVQRSGSPRPILSVRGGLFSRTSKWIPGAPRVSVHQANTYTSVTIPRHLTKADASRLLAVLHGGGRE